MLTHPTPRADANAQARCHGESVRRAARSGPRQRSQVTPTGWPCCSTARSPTARPDASKRGMRKAHLRHSQASIEDVDYRTPRQFRTNPCSSSWWTCRWVVEHRSLLVTGPCGVGKSWLACALGQKACRDGHRRPLHACAAPVRAELELALGDGRGGRLFRTLVKADLLILDDWGPDRLNPNQRRDLMEIVEDRYRAGSTLITSQLPIDKWHDVIGEPTFAMPSSIASSTTPIAWNSTAHQCGRSRPTSPTLPWRNATSRTRAAPPRRRPSQ